MDAKATLVSYTACPEESLYILWMASRKQDWAQYDPAVIRADRETDRELDAEVMRVFREVVAADIPVAENLSFTFIIDNVSIALREQMVRHRIGVHCGDNYGVDVIPDLADSTWWSQSMRILDMRYFAAEGHFLLPESILADPKALDSYVSYMTSSAQAYHHLLKLGIPMEDARNVLPLAATSRISWTLNMSALQRILRKRSCWILQLGMWGPLMTSMAKELREKVSPSLAELTHPPCMCNGNYESCKFVEDNNRRVQGHDEIPPCPLWLWKESASAVEASRQLPLPAWYYSQLETCWHSRNPHNVERMNKMVLGYAELWGVDPDELAAPLG